MRASIALLLAFIFMNAGVGLIDWTTSGDLGAEPETGDPAELDGLNPNETTSNENEDTLFGLRSGLASQLGGFLGDLFPAVDMLDAAGVPDEILAYVFAPLSLYTTLDLMGFLRNGALLQN